MILSRPESGEGSLAAEWEAWERERDNLLREIEYLRRNVRGLRAVRSNPERQALEAHDHAMQCQTERDAAERRCAELEEELERVATALEDTMQRLAD